MRRRAAWSMSAGLVPLPRQSSSRSRRRDASRVIPRIERRDNGTRGRVDRLDAALRRASRRRDRRLARKPAVGRPGDRADHSRRRHEEFAGGRKCGAGSRSVRRRSTPPAASVPGRAEREGKQRQVVFDQAATRCPAGRIPDPKIGLGACSSRSWSSRGARRASEARHDDRASDGAEPPSR